MSENLFNKSAFDFPRTFVPSAWTQHAPFAFWLVTTLKPSLLVELGTHHGFSYFCFCQAVADQKLSTACYAVDTWKGDPHAGHYSEDVWHRVSNINAELYADFSTLLRSSFNDAVDSFAEGSIDLLHIDGGHSYAEVKNDFLTWRSRMSPNGIVLFHDIFVTEPGFGVHAFWNELKKQYPSFQFEHGYGLGVLCVGQEPAPSIRKLFDVSGDDSERLFVAQIYEELGQRLTQAEADHNEIAATRADLGVSQADLAVSQADLAASQKGLDSAQRERQSQAAELAQLHERVKLLESNIALMVDAELATLQEKAALEKSAERMALDGYQFHLNFVVNSKALRLRDFAFFMPVKHAFKLLRRSIKFAVKRRLRVLRGKPSFKPEHLAAIQNPSSRSSSCDGPTIDVILIDDGASNQATTNSVESIVGQSSQNWRLLLARVERPGGTQGALLRQKRKQFKQGRITTLADGHRNYGAALNAAAAASTNDFILVLRAGDRLDASAIGFLSSELLSHPSVDILYADETYCLDATSTRLTQLKPGWSPEMLTSYNYFGRPTVIRRSKLLEAGCFDVSLDDACEWDISLKLTEHHLGSVAPPQIRHLPEVLCHRYDMRGDRQDCESATAGKENVLSRYWQRHGKISDITSHRDGTLSARWEIEHEPLVSIIIPNKNAAQLLSKCVEDLLDKTAYSAKEIIVVDNGSNDPATLRLYDDLKAKDVRIVDFHETFNYSRACNRGAEVAAGEMLLFLNNDIEVIDADWLAEMVRFACRPGVGIVGTKLIYPDGILQHAGVVIGMHLCGLVFNRADMSAWGPLGSPNVARNWLGIMGACQLVRRDVFDRVGGFNEDYQIAMSDIRLCLDAWRAGFRTAYAPNAALIHHEGATRGHTNPTADLQKAAADIRALGFEDDPYFHHLLDPDIAIPSLRAPARPTLPKNLEATIAQLIGSSGNPKVPDIFDDGDIAKAAGRRAVDIVWSPDPVDAMPDGLWAARLMIDLLRRRSDLRKRFPRALSDGKTGEFAQWLKNDAIVRFGLPAGASDAIDDAFDIKLGVRTLEIILYDEGFREREPLFLLADGRRTVCRYVFDLVAGSRLGLEDVWWFLLQAAEDEAGAVATTYAFTPDWQKKFPAGLSRFGREGFARWLTTTFGLTGAAVEADNWPVAHSDSEEFRLAWLSSSEWQQRFPNIGHVAEAKEFIDMVIREVPPAFADWASTLDTSQVAKELAKPAVNFFSHFSYPSGLQTSARSIAKSLSANGVDSIFQDVRVDLDKSDLTHHQFSRLATQDISIVHVQPEPFFGSYESRADRSELSSSVYRIGFWYWEFDSIPAEWQEAADACDELWAATKFIGDALKARFNKHVEVFFPGLELPHFTALPRSKFGIRDDSFVFLSIFHMMSVMERKNPLAAMEAFSRAFPNNENVVLIVKTTFGFGNPPELERLMRHASMDPRIRVIDESYSSEELLALINVCDVCVSLHRSEGLGLTPAEAMLMGKPTIATRYSGNLDFMNDANSALVDYTLIRLDRDVPPYKKGLYWADPDIGQAASLMRKMFEDRSYATDLGIRAKKDMQARFSYASAGRAMAERLREIRKARFVSTDASKN